MYCAAPHWGWPSERGQRDSRVCPRQALQATRTLPLVSLQPESEGLSSPNLPDSGFAGEEESRGPTRGLARIRTKLAGRKIAQWQRHWKHGAYAQQAQVAMAAPAHRSFQRPKAAPVRSSPAFAARMPRGMRCASPYFADQYSVCRQSCRQLRSATDRSGRDSGPPSGGVTPVPPHARALQPLPLSNCRTAIPSGRGRSRSPTPGTLSGSPS